MRLEISRSVVEGILAEASRNPAREVCGLLFGTAWHVDRFQTCANVASDPRGAFEIDPASLIAAYRAQRQGGDRIVGCFHSHPFGSPEPSQIDAGAAAPNDWVWLIAAGGDIGAWRAVERGARHGRFDPVDWQSA